MSTLATPRLRIPRIARAGEAFEIRTLMEHRMETGLRHDGNPAPARDMLTGLEVTIEGETVFAATLRNGTAANPFHVFHLRLARTSDIVFTWTDEQGRTATARHRITIA